MPSPLIETSRLVRPVDAGESSNEVGRASQDEGNLPAQAHGLDDRREEVLEAVGGEMHVLHQGKEPDLGIAGRLLETNPWAFLAFFANSVTDDAAVGKDAFLGGQPASVGGVVGKNKSGSNGDNKGYGTWLRSACM